MSIKRPCIAISALLLIAIIFGLVLSSSVVSADDSVVDQVALTVPISCTMSGTGMNSHTAALQNNTYTPNIGTTTLHAFCNDTNGFAIYAAGYTGDEIGGTNSTKLVGTPSTIGNIDTGTATSGNTSNWAMKLAIAQDSGDTTGTNAVAIDNSFNNYHVVPNEYTKVAHKNTSTNMDSTTGGVKLTTTYAAFINTTQPAGTYTGKVIYTLVHPSTEIPPSPQPSTPGYINYYANASTAEGTMGRQSAADGDTVRLFASNFSRDGYGFAGWSDVYDYTTNTNANFYGPNEDITVPTGTTTNGLALYAVWIESAGTMQTNAQSVCNGLTAATYSNEGDSDESTWSITAGLSSVSALTDNRDGQTYAIAKLSDNRCWMIENLRLADTHQEGGNTIPTILTASNTNNPSLPLTNIYDTGSTSNHLSPTSSVAYDATTAPEGWCIASSAACIDQSRLRTDNTSDRATFTTDTDMTDHAINLYGYGNYYDWYSITAGNGTYNKSNGNTDGDLCPYGWRLSAGTGSGDFGLLSNSLGGYKNANNVAQNMSSSTSPTGPIMNKRLRHFPNNYVCAGYAYGASINIRGNSGYYWSSTAYTNSEANGLGFNNNVVYPGTNYNVKKYHGRPVRCIANSSS